MHSTTRLGLALVFSSLVGVGVCRTANAQPAFRGSHDAYMAAPTTRGVQVSAVPSGLRVASRDGRTHAPTLLVGRAALSDPSATNVVRRGASHLRVLAPLYGLTAQTLPTAELALARATNGGGSLVVFRQRVDGVEVFEAEASLLLDPQGSLRAAGGQLRPVSDRAYTFANDEATAVTVALADCWARPAPRGHLVLPSAGRRSHQTDRYFDVTAAARSAGYVLDEPARARRVLFPMPTRLVPAIYVELFITTPARGPLLVAYVVSAEDSSILHRRLLTDDDVFYYTVYAEDSAPFVAYDSPFGDLTPDASGVPVDLVPWSFATQRVVAMEGFNTNPAGGADPWLPSGATETVGNNVDAYTDTNEPNGFSAGDLRAATSAPGVFDHVFDPMREPDDDDTQTSATVTQLFYVNNWLHDYFYDLGFTESAGNAQDENFGRGGEEGDRLRVEAMDYAGINNANMSTPADGSSPRMQMFFWQGASNAQVEADGSTHAAGVARWGPTLFDLSAPTVLVDDGVAPVTDGCDPISADLDGRIALIDRGSCNFSTKVLGAQAAGAVGVIVMNDRAGGTMTMGGTPPSPVTIPSLFVTREDGAVLRAVALGTPARMFRGDARPRPESSMDATVVVHEWGHYIHNRLVRGSSRQKSAAGEGWGDALALIMLARPDDDFAGAHPHAGFSNHGRAPIYFGTRRVPYSTDRALDDLSFRHISVGEPLPTTHPLDPSSSNNAEVHNAGEVWATMLFDAFASLVDRSREAGAPYDFDEARRRFASYIVLGMQLAPRAPTYIEQRDALIAAALDTDVEDALWIARAFAERGAGSCAIGPPSDSTDLVGVVEDFAVGAAGAISELVVVPGGSGRLCDADGLLDAGEEGTIDVVIHNTGLTPFSGATMEVEVEGDAATLPMGGSFEVRDLAPGDRDVVSVPIAIDETRTVADYVTVRATLRGSALCEEVRTERRVAMDRDAEPSVAESFETVPSWFAESSVDGTSLGVWSVGPSRLGDPDGVLRAIDASSPTDTAVELPEVTASDTEPLVLSFEHRFEFEAADGISWDGGVVELSLDAGTTWTDVAWYVDPEYTGVLSDRAGNPLSLRAAYSGTNPSAPAADLVVLDFRSTLAGRRVRFRFRVGTDAATGATGWEIDDLILMGGDPLPFTGLTDDIATCDGVPIADAGPDIDVHSGEMFSLDATGSSDPDGDPLTFAWTVISGEPPLRLSSATSETPRVTAPMVDEETVFVLRLRVSDGRGSDGDEMRIRVLPGARIVDGGMMAVDGDMMPADGGGDGAPRMLPQVGGGGCSCRIATGAGERGRSHGGLWLLGAIAVWVARGSRRPRRRR